VTTRPLGNLILDGVGRNMTGVRAIVVVVVVEAGAVVLTTARRGVVVVFVG
jgi:hypothetical protein